VPDAHGHPAHLSSVDLTQGPSAAPELLYAGDAGNFWLEDDQILVVSAGTGLSTLPQAGGPVVPVPSVKSPGNIAALDRSFVYSYTSDEFAENPPALLWRSARDGSGDEQLFSLSADELRGHSSGLLHVGDRWAVMYSAPDIVEASAWSVSLETKKGGPLPVPQEATAPIAFATLLGISDDGETLLWTYASEVRRDMGEEPYRVYSYAFAGADGSAPVPFAIKLPARTTPLAAWPAAGGSWYLATTEEHQEDHVFVTVWSVDVSGAAARIACDPTDWDDNVLGNPAGAQDHRTDRIVASGTVTAGRLLFAIRYQNGPWVVVEVDDPPTKTKTMPDGSP